MRELKFGFFPSDFQHSAVQRSEVGAVAHKRDGFSGSRHVGPFAENLDLGMSSWATKKGPKASCIYHLAFSIYHFPCVPRRLAQGSSLARCRLRKSVPFSLLLAALGRKL